MDKNFAIAYCLDNNIKYLEMVRESSRSLRKYNKSVPIHVVTTQKINNIYSKYFKDLNINLIRVNPIFNKFPHDKCLIGRLKIDNLLLIDCDTLIFGDIQKIFKLSKADISARLSFRYSKKWEQKYQNLWENANNFLKIPVGPIINSGVVIFRNKSHLRLFKTWVEIIHKFINQEINEVYGDEWMFEQLSLSMAISKLDLRLHILQPKYHCFGWDSNELKPEKCLIIHTNSSKYCEIKKILLEKKDS